MSQFIHGESEIPSSFDELESGDDAGLIMRTAVDFELISDDGSLVAIEHLGKGTTAILVGYIIEPIQNDIKHSMIDLLCTSSQDLPSDAELAMLLPIAQKRRRGSVPNKENVIGTDIWGLWRQEKGEIEEEKEVSRRRNGTQIFKEIKQ